MEPSRILVIDDEIGMLEVCRDTLEALPGATIECISDAHEGLRCLEADNWDLLVLDIRMPGMDGVELLRRARAIHPDLAVLMITAFPTVETAVEAMRLGAEDYVTKPFIPDELLTKAHRALERRSLQRVAQFLERQVEGAARFDELVGDAPAMRALYDMIERVAPADADVLVMGESGTGKELVARSVHRRSGRPGRFVPIDCGAIPENLFESELFGHERGAFTGADSRRPGLLEFAEGGTAFFDEVGELPAALQPKLLRVLQERRIRRVGGRDEIPVDLRIIAATNRDLREEVKAGRFREDLFFRLNVVPMTLPPLRDRGEDVRRLFEHFLAHIGGRRAPPIRAASPDLVAALRRYSWPGNVRELQSTVRRMVALCRSDELTLEDLPDELALHAPSRPVGADPVVAAATSSDTMFAMRAAHVDAFEERYLRESLAGNAGDVAAAAAQAGLPRGTFYRLLKKHGLSANSFRPDAAAE